MARSMADEKGSSRTAIWVVGAAAVVLFGAVGYSLSQTDSAPTPTPAAAKLAANQPETIDGMQAAARAAPTDPKGWATLGNALFNESRFAESAAAFDKASSLAPERADLWSALGEARVMADQKDPMPPAALAAFRKSLTIDPKDPRSRYFTAVARDLSGDHKGALDDWFSLLKDTPPGAPWESDLRRTIAQVGKINKLDVDDRLAALSPKVDVHAPMSGGLRATAAIPGPSADQMRAASALPPSQQDGMVQQMVGQLEGKLKANPANIDGWVMLMRSRVTLGERAKASRALADAIAANPGAKARLQNEAAALGVTS